MSGCRGLSTCRCKGVSAGVECVGVEDSKEEGKEKEVKVRKERRKRRAGPGGKRK